MLDRGIQTPRMRNAIQFGHGQYYGAVESRRTADRFSLAILSAGPSVERHTHTEAHFVFVLGGTYNSSAKGAEDPGGVATLIYNPPGTTHVDRFVRDQGRFFGLSIKARDVSELDADLDLAERPQRLRHPRSLAMASAAVRHVPHDGPDAGTMLESLSLELLATIARRKPTTGRAPPRWLKTACAMITDSVAPLSVAQIARAVDVHPVHLARVFRTHLRASPGDVARKFRLERATDLLLRRRACLAEIAHTAGYADQSHFTRDFVREAGMTPAKFRAALK